jgi:hypothetical protein
MVMLFEPKTKRIESQVVRSDNRAIIELILPVAQRMKTIAEQNRDDGT